MTDVNWLGVMLPLGGAAVACLARLLPVRCESQGGPLRLPLWDAGRACIFLLLFAALVLASNQVDPLGEWAPLRVALDYGGTLGLLALVFLPAARDRAAGWARAGFGPLPPAAVIWLVVLMAGVAVFRIVLLTYVPCNCPALDPRALGWVRVAASAAFTGFLVPLAEEVLYRGVALPLIGVRAGRWGGTLLAAISWAMVHGERPLLPLIVLGVALGKLTLGTGSLWPSIGFHIAWNAAVVGYEVYGRVVGLAGAGPVPAPVIFFAVVGLVLGWAQLLDAGRAGAVWITLREGAPGAAAESRPEGGAP